MEKQYKTYLLQCFKHPMDPNQAPYPRFRTRSPISDFNCWSLCIFEAPQDEEVGSGLISGTSFGLRSSVTFRVVFLGDLKSFLGVGCVVEAALVRAFLRDELFTVSGGVPSSLSSISTTLGIGTSLGGSSSPGSSQSFPLLGLGVFPLLRFAGGSSFLNSAIFSNTNRTPKS